MDFTDLKEKLASYGNSLFGSGATAEDIKKAEVILEIKFSNSYREFLIEFGWGGVECIELYGLGADVPDYLNVVKVTLSERNEMEPALQKDLIPLLNDGFGNHYCLDTGRMTDLECPVVFWNHEEASDQDVEIVAPNFSTWLMSMLTS